MEHELGKEGADPAQHCEHCWCGVCEVPVHQCKAAGTWPGHCSTTAAQARERQANARAADLGDRLAAVPRASPPPPGGPSASLLLDSRWLQLRHTALSYLAHCGRDEDGVVATLVLSSELALPEAQGVLAALVATDEVVALGSELHVRPGVDIGPEPLPPGPPGDPLHVWLTRPLPPSGAPQLKPELLAKVLAQASQQALAWSRYFAQQTRAAASRGSQAGPWTSYYQDQARAREQKAPLLLQQLTRAWQAYEHGRR